MIKATNTWNMHTSGQEKVPCELAEARTGCRGKWGCEKKHSISPPMSNESGGWIRKDLLQAGRGKLWKARRNEGLGTREVPEAGQPPPATPRESRLVEWPIVFIPLTFPVLSEGTGWWRTDNADLQSLTQEARLRVKQLTPDSNVKIRCTVF